MRLGKEQAVGYVEDTEADVLAVPEVATAPAVGMPLTADESSLTAS